MSGKVGLDCKLYYSSNLETPSWTELVAVDVSMDEDVGMAELSNRSSLFVKGKPHLIDLGLTFDMIWNSTDAGMLALRAAARDRTPLAFAMLDGDKDGEDTVGDVVYCYLTKSSRSEPLKDGAKVSFEAKLAFGQPDPEAWEAAEPGP